MKTMIKLLFLYLFVALTLIFITFDVKAATKEQTEEIFNALIIVNNIHNHIKFTIDDADNDVNAYSQRGVFIDKVIITGNAIKSLNINEIAFTLGHELGHLTSGHLNNPHLEEFRADTWGVLYANNAGYDGCKGMHWLLRYGDDDSVSHPRSSIRIAEVCGR